MYIGAITDAAPIATPPKNRENKSRYQLSAIAHPRAEKKNNTPQSESIARRPNASPGFPIAMEPSTVPQRAMDTVTPSVASERVKY
jgi:hypothetical protein